MRLGTETGSLVNHVSAIPDRAVAARVGDGATILQWTDRTAGTVIRVTSTQIHVQEDHAKRTDANGWSDMQTYAYTPNPDGPVYIFRRTRCGWRAQGAGLMLGQRSQYHDYSF